VAHRWDPTNVIEGAQLKVSIITSISKDHQEVLGDTLPQIAWEKVLFFLVNASRVSLYRPLTHTLFAFQAGIIKKDIPAVTMASQDLAALRVLEEEARIKETQLHVIEAVRASTPLQTLLIVCDLQAHAHVRLSVEQINEEAVELLRPRLEGDTQRDNVTLAVAALGIWLRNDLAPEQADAQLARMITEGLSHKVYHPCRFEIFAVPSSHDDGAPRTVPVVIDGGHNEDGLRRMFIYARKRYLFVVCALDWRNVS
jgi:dihydrofolate synthase/folylpolyglutamate synthase